MSARVAAVAAPRGREAAGAQRLPLLTGSAAAVALAAGSWSTGVATGAAILVLLLAPFALRRSGARFDRGLLTALGVFVAVLAYAVLSAPDSGVAMERADAYWPLLLLIAAPVMGCAKDPHRAFLRFAVVASLVGAAAGALATLQWLEWAPPPRHDTRGFTGTSRQIPFRDVLAAVLPVAALAMLEVRRRRTSWMLLGCIALLICGLLASGGRTALVAGSFAAALVVAAHPRLGRRGWLALLIPPAIVVGAALAGVGPFRWLHELLDVEALSRREGARVAMWDVAWNAFLAHPWTGIGLGNLGQAIAESPHLAEYPPAVTGLLEAKYSVPPHAHSLPLHVAATQGVVGIAAWLLLVGTLLRRYLRAWRSAPAAAALGLGGLALLAISGLTDYPMAFTVRAIPYFAVLAAALALARPPLAESDSDEATSFGAEQDRRARTASVIVCTYNAAEQLELVLAALARQSQLPGEVIVADDGSGPATRALVESFTAAFPCPLHHVWHEDRGCRRSGIVNQAVLESCGEHLLFLDGDTVPHLHWVRDHLALADGKRILCGRRVRLGPDYTPSFSRARIERGDFDGLPPLDLLASALRGDTKRLGFGLRLPRLLQTLLHPRRDKKLMGCNFSLPRGAFEEVNGFDEAWPGSALLSDDWDLEIRLRRTGRRLEPLLHTGVTYHLHHEPRSVAPQEVQMREQRVTEAPDRAAKGLDARRPRRAEDAAAAAPAGSP